MKLVNTALLLAILLLTGCALNQESKMNREGPDVSMNKYNDNVHVSEIGATWLQINQDLKSTKPVKEALITQWLNNDANLTGTERLRCVALLLVKDDPQSHLNALRLLITLTDQQKIELLPIIDWLTVMAKIEIIEDSQMRDVNQQLSEAQFKINALQNKIKELKTLESNLLSKPSENH